MTANAPRNRRSNMTVSLTLAAVAAQATGTPSPLTATWNLVPFLPRSVGLGPVSSPPRLARTEQLSMISVGLPRSMATSRAWTRPSTPVLAQCSKCRRSVEPLASAAVACKLRHGVPSRTKRRKQASTRTTAARGYPGPCLLGPSQHSITVAIRSKILKFIVASPRQTPKMGTRSTDHVTKPSQPGVDVKTDAVDGSCAASVCQARSC